jgi:hypothetical protein
VHTDEEGSMSEHQSGPRQWVVEPPPAAGQTALYVACGEGVELTDEQEAALGALLRSLEDADVVGFAGNECVQCWPLKCTRLDCGRLYCNLNQLSGSGPGWNLMGSFSPRAQ